jgi:hypothetical protein
MLHAIMRTRMEDMRMAGPTCEVLSNVNDSLTLDVIDALLTSVAEQINRTRKGRVWDVWIAGRPVHLSVSGSPPSVALAAGCNDAEDYALLRRLSGEIAAVLHGVATEPIK